MMFTFNTATLARAVKAAAEVINRKPSLEILNNVLISIDDGMATISATDLDISLRQSVEAKGEGNAALCINPKTLGGILSALTVETVTLDVSTIDRPVLKCKEGRFKLHALPFEDFPSMPSAVAPESVCVGGMLELLSRTTFSASTDDSRPNLNGVLFQDAGDGSARMVSTDGHRLSLATRRLGITQAFDPVIIPRRAAVVLRKMLEGMSATVVRMGWAESNVMFSGEGRDLFIRLIDLKFPDYTAVIPNASEHRIEVNRAAMMAAVKRTCLMASDRTKSVALVIGADAIEMSSENSELGSASTSVECRRTSEGDVSIACNARYITDALGALSTDFVTVDVNSELAPMMIRPVDGGDDQFIIMPVRI